MSAQIKKWCKLARGVKVKRRKSVLGDTVEICRHGDLAPGIFAPLFLPHDNFAWGESYSAGQKSPPLTDSGALLLYLQRMLFIYREPVALSLRLNSQLFIISFNILCPED